MPTAEKHLLLQHYFTELEAVVAAVSNNWSPYPHQQPPEGDWDIWIIKGGRGSGKTEAGARDVLDHLREFGSMARVGIGAPTIADVRDVCAEGETGLITLAPSEFPIYNRSLLEATHINGGKVKFMGSEKPNRWNGPQWTMLWWDELALCVEESWDQSQFGLRLGPHPRCVVTTTPKNRRFVKALYTTPGVVVTHGTTYDNPALAARVIRKLEARYGGTTLGRQELMGEDIDQVEGALWQRVWIDKNRTPEGLELPDLIRVVVAIDPAATHGKDADETGIAVAGKGMDGRFYVLHGFGYKLSPNGWANKAIDLYDQYEADKVIAEINNGGEMVSSTIRQVNKDIPLKTIHASRGKTVRAEPVAALYEQGKVSHVGVFPELEDQMCSFPVANEYDDMVDAVVYALTELSDLTPEKTFMIGAAV